MTDTPINFPSKESLNDLHNGINEALGRFRAANPDVQGGVICGSAFNIMLSFAHTWMTRAGTQDRFVEFVKGEATHFLTLKAMAEAEMNG